MQPASLIPQTKNSAETAKAAASMCLLVLEDFYKRQLQRLRHDGNQESAHLHKRLREQDQKMQQLSVELTWSRQLNETPANTLESPEHVPNGDAVEKDVAEELRERCTWQGWRLRCLCNELALKEREWYENEARLRQKMQQQLQKLEEQLASSQAEARRLRAAVLDNDLIDSPWEGNVADQDITPGTPHTTSVEARRAARAARADGLAAPDSQCSTPETQTSTQASQCHHATPSPKLSRPPALVIENDRAHTLNLNSSEPSCSPASALSIPRKLHQRRRSIECNCMGVQLVVDVDLIQQMVSPGSPATCA